MSGKGGGGIGIPGVGGAGRGAMSWDSLISSWDMLDSDLGTSSETLPFSTLSSSILT